MTQLTYLLYLLHSLTYLLAYLLTTYRAQGDQPCGAATEQWSHQAVPAVHAPLPGVLPYCYLVITPSRRGTCRHSKWTRCNACDCITFPMAILTMAPYLL